MKYVRPLVIGTLLSVLSSVSYAQGILPDISVRELTKGKVQISWNNPYQSCIQLAIQRSTDSVNNFRTIFSSQSPELPSNGYVDNKPVRGIKSYYRIFYVLQGGAYYFSKIVAADIKWENPVVTAPVMKGPMVTEKNMISIYVKGSQVFTFTKAAYARFRDSINNRTNDGLSRINENTIEWIPRPVKRNSDQKLISVYGKEGLIVRLTESAYRKFKDSLAGTKDSLYMIDPFRIQLRHYVKVPDFISVFRNDSLIRQLEIPLYRKFRDSMASTTRDTLFVINNYRLDIHPYLPKYVWRPSVYVYTNAKGYVTLLLPLVKQHRYRIVFYEDEAHTAELFQVKSVKEAELVLDKANFMHAGWFYFELFEDDKLKEKNKFFLSRD